MKKYTVIDSFALLALAFATSVAPVWSVPASTTHATQQSTVRGQTAPQTQSVSGKIASVDKDSFTLTVGSPSISNQGQQPDQASPKTMKFVTDAHTTVDGDLKVGANADVSYRNDNGRNLAISVRVSQ